MMDEAGGDAYARRAPAARPIAGVTKLDGLYFGLAAAENEVAEDAERFRRTYYDRWNLPEVIERHKRFLLLGPKGAGKSAAAWHVVLDWQHRFGRESVFETFVDFDELNRTQSPLTSLGKGLVSADVTTMTDTAWRLFIGVRLLESLMKDPACTLSADWQARRLLDDLQAVGLASDDYPKVLRSVRERKTVLGYSKIAGVEFASKDGEAMSPGQLGSALLTLSLNASTPNYHLLAIDGLDKAITENESYWQTLAALIRVTDGLRRGAARTDQCRVYVLVMCRSDVFRRVSFADAPKIAADGAVHIEWHAEASDPRDVLLWEYLARKAEVQTEELLSLMPPAIQVGRVGGVETLKFILDFTRYTPRDATLLFNQIRDDWRGSDGHITGAQIRSSADRFASQHLLSEITAEATGLLPRKVVGRLDSVLSALPSRVFRRSDLELAMRETGVAEDIDAWSLGEYLFLQGAIGNYKPASGYYQFYHRRDAYKFARNGPWALHSGLVYALNVPWSGL